MGKAKSRGLKLTANQRRGTDKKAKNKDTLKWCKGNKQRPHKPTWIEDMNWGPNIWKLWCRSCGTTLGSARMVKGEPSVIVRKFTGYEDFLRGPKGYGS